MFQTVKKLFFDLSIFIQSQIKILKLYFVYDLMITLKILI